MIARANDIASRKAHNESLLVSAYMWITTPFFLAIKLVTDDPDSI